jgi:MarR family transcriptional regulator, organic hydroperoxide resistance regulator
VSAARAHEGGTLVAQVHHLAGRVFGRILRSHGVDDLNPAQGRIVYALWKEDAVSQATLAARTRLDKSTLALMLDRLEMQGHVRRQQDPRDGRRRIIRLTAKNRAMHAAYTRASAEMVAIFYRGMADRDVEAFEVALRKVLANLEAAGA